MKKLYKRSIGILILFLVSNLIVSPMVHFNSYTVKPWDYSIICSLIGTSILTVGILLFFGLYKIILWAFDLRY